jgi:hypothetical protein
MPRYFFHVKDSTEYIDREGVELSGSDQARQYAVIAAGEMLKDLGGAFWNGEEWHMRVVDGGGNRHLRAQVLGGVAGKPVRLPSSGCADRRRRTRRPS